MPRDEAKPRGEPVYCPGCPPVPKCAGVGLDILLSIAITRNKNSPGNLPHHTVTARAIPAGLSQRQIISILAVSGADFTVLDVKVKDALGSDAGEVSGRGAFVAFGNTQPGARAQVLGVAQRGQLGDRAFNARTGLGYVAAVKGDYDRAAAKGVLLVPALVETFGGVGPELQAYLVAAAEARQNRLTRGEYDETTWAARTWTSFVSQRISVAAQLAMAQEAAEALGMSVAADPRGGQ